MSNIYDDVALLQEQVAALQVATADSGWQNLTLSGGASAYADSQIPQYRKIGKIVFLRGAVKNISGACTIGILPIGCRPETTFSFIQNTSIRTGSFAMNARYTINSDGEIRLEFISDGAAYDTTKWFPIHASFAI